jgi:hypothetical protein
VPTPITPTRILSLAPTADRDAAAVSAEPTRKDRLVDIGMLLLYREWLAALHARIYPFARPLQVRGARLTLKNARGRPGKSSLIRAIPRKLFPLIAVGKSPFRQ